jgi:hypothetical protein
MWARQDSNLGPTDYESAALTAELRARGAAEGSRRAWRDPATGRPCPQLRARYISRSRETGHNRPPCGQGKRRLSEVAGREGVSS